MMQALLTSKYAKVGFLHVMVLGMVLASTSCSMTLFPPKEEMNVTLLGLEESYPQGEPIEAVAVVNDYEDPWVISWFIDGSWIADGSSKSSSFRFEGELPSGEHTLEAKVSGAEDSREGRALKTFVIDETTVPEDDTQLPRTTEPPVDPELPVEPETPIEPETPVEPVTPEEPVTGMLPATHGFYLNEYNTGVPEGHVLRDVVESITVTEEWIQDSNGGSRVIENRNFLSGAGVTIRAGNITIRYCKFNGLGGIYLPDAVEGIRIEDSEFDGNQENLTSRQAIKNSNASIHLLRLNIHHWPRALTVVKGDTIVESCYLHDLTSDDSGAHIENIYVAGGDKQIYIGNKMIANPVSINPGQTDYAISASLAIYNQGASYEDLDDIQVVDNYIDGVGSYAFYGGACEGKSGPYATNTVVTGNVFGRTYRRRGGQYGPVTAFSTAEQGNKWENNTWGDRGPYWQSGDPEAGSYVVPR